MVSTHLILGFFHHKMEQADIFKQEQSEKQLVVPGNADIISTSATCSTIIRI